MLEKMPMFDGLSAEQIARLEGVGRIDEVAEGVRIFSEGDRADGLYVIVDGTVVITHREHDSEIELSRLGAGEFFGELALFDGAPRSASATAVAPSRLFVLGSTVFSSLIGTNPDLVAKMLVGISARIRGSNEKFLQQMIEKEKVRTEMERERYRSLAQMVAGVAHEINTPLGIVNTATSIIKENLGPLREGGGDTADIDEAIGLIEGSLSRVNALVLSFKNLSVAQVIERREELDLKALVAEILTLFSGQAKRAGIVIATDFPDTPLQWVGFAGYLSQILLNLLTNIERYAYPGSVGGRVEVRVAEEGDHFRITVRDYGAGIAPADLARVYEPFFTTGRARGGTGLGLSIVHNLVTTALHGSIDISSEPGAGTTITLDLPRVVPETAAK